MLRGANRWLSGYLGSLSRRPQAVSGTRHLIIAICDHYEPYRAGADQAAAHASVDQWVREYPKTVDGFFDADGCAPRQTFFYPEEDYDPACIDKLAALARQGLGEVEIHLHHRNDTPEGLREKLVRFRDVLHGQHGMLGCRVDCDVKPSDSKEPVYGFIHGNWALCNSRPDGDWCGVNEELSILAETGCYADLTFPSAPSPTQPKTVNAIYRAQDNPNGRGHDHGTLVRAPTSDCRPPASGLLLIQGPFCLNFAWRKWGVLPRLENADISGRNPPTPLRARLWTRAGVHVSGRPEWVFVKLHTHGCAPANAAVLLGESMRQMHRDLSASFNDGERWKLHYVTAREMTNIVLAAEAGLSGDPGGYRDYLYDSPQVSR